MSRRAHSRRNGFRSATLLLSHADPLSANVDTEPQFNTGRVRFPVVLDDGGPAVGAGDQYGEGQGRRFAAAEKLRVLPCEVSGRYSRLKGCTFGDTGDAFGYQPESVQGAVLHEPIRAGGVSRRHRRRRALRGYRCALIRSRHRWHTATLRLVPFPSSRPAALPLWARSLIAGPGGRCKLTRSCDSRYSQTRDKRRSTAREDTMPRQFSGRGVRYRACSSAPSWCLRRVARRRV
jgi:hypothetical protein